MTRFTAATLGLVALLILAVVLGGIWTACALLYITVFTFFLDKLSTLAGPDDPGIEFPAGTGLSLALALMHFPLFFGAVAVVANDTAPPLDRVLVFFAVALFAGQVSNSNAHELIHRQNRMLRLLGTSVYTSMLFGHHVSAHLRVHHVHAATNRDPNSARLGENFYAFALRAWWGSFRAGWQAEARLRRDTAGLHPYAIYLGGAALSVALAAALAGGAGVAALLGLSLYAQTQLLLSDYVQHYGLRRNQTAPNRWEPIGPSHSWNAPHGFSAALMLNAPRHSDHHAHPARAYPGLALDRARMPVLPQSLPVMAVLALLPPVWHRLMDRRARKWAAAQPG